MGGGGRFELKESDFEEAGLHRAGGACKPAPLACPSACLARLFLLLEGTCEGTILSLIGGPTKG
jgi:hypothetical protein